MLQPDEFFVVEVMMNVSKSATELLFLDQTQKHPRLITIVTTV